MIQRNSLKFAPSDSEYTADFSIMVDIKRGDSSLACVTYDRFDRVASLENITTTQKIPDEFSFHIKPGRYTIHVTITDNNSGETRRREKEVDIKEFPSDKLAFSDIEFATKIERVNTSGHFIKNQLLIIPNADGIYGGELMTAYYYSEIYNLSTDESEKKYIVYRQIFDENLKLIKELEAKERPQKAASVVEADFFSCATLPTGAYFLQLKAQDGETGDTSSVWKKFWVYRPGETPAPQAVSDYGNLNDAIGKLSDEEANAELDYIRYLIDRADERLIKQIKPEGFKNFLLNFWKNKDATGAMRYRYLTRITASNERFKSPFTPGWKTDRGRTFILYGEPDAIERRHFQFDSPDSEIWYYDQIEGGIMFLFSDIKGTSDFQQVYSTKVGEYIDAGWLQKMEQQNPGFIQEIQRRQ
jgi:GWxTD domain-containing protein